MMAGVSCLKMCAHEQSSHKHITLTGLFVSLLFVHQCSAAISVVHDPLLCFTSSGDLGDCRPWRFCPSVREEYPAKKPTICLYRPINPIVCCPHVSSASSTTTTTTTTPRPASTVNLASDSGEWRPIIHLPASATTSQSEGHHATVMASSEPVGESNESADILWPDQAPQITAPSTAAPYQTAKPTTSSPSPTTHSSTSETTTSAQELSEEESVGDFIGHPDCGLNTDTLHLNFNSLKFRRKRRDTEIDRNETFPLDPHTSADASIGTATSRLIFNYFDSLNYQNISKELEVELYTESPPTRGSARVAKTPSGSQSPDTERRRADLKEDKQGRQLFADYFANSIGHSDGVSSGFSYITGGYKANIGKWPWLALVGEKRAFSTEWFCGASLINEQFVLTAGHCLGKFQKNRLLVRLGEYDLNYDTDGRHQDLLVARIYLHPQYRPQSKHHDIALLQLRRRAQFTALVRPVCLWAPGRAALTGRLVKAAGWGHTQFGGETSAVLREVQLPVVDTVACERKYRGVRDSFERDFGGGFGDGKLCAHDISGAGGDACQGDSGGPLTYWDRKSRRTYLVGIVSTGIGCGHPVYPGVYTRVATYLSWIRQKAFATS